MIKRLNLRGKIHYKLSFIKQIGSQRNRFWFSNKERTYKLKLATLNNCGIMNNPFEFYSKEYRQELSQISFGLIKVLEKFLPGFDKNKHSWVFSRLDQKIRKRYSPLFWSQAGINMNKNAFDSIDQFSNKWEAAFNQEFLASSLKATATLQKQKSALQQFDLFIFHAILNYVYNKPENQPLPLSELLNNPIQPYLNLTKRFHSLPFVDMKRKTWIMNKHILQGMNPSVLFLQQASQNLIEVIRKQGQYDIIGEHQSNKVVVKIGEFSKKWNEKQTLSSELLQKLKQIERTSLAHIDNFVFLGVHLKSAKELAQKETVVLLNFVNEFNAKYPHLNLIVGGDANLCMGQKMFEYPNLNCSPIDANSITTMKKRSYLQAQYNKAQIDIKESKSFILSNLKVQNGRILKLKEEGIAPSDPTDRLPSAHHPFDHYILTSQVTVQK